MIINPREIYNLGIIQGVELEEQIQQNGIDIRLKELYRIRGAMHLGINFKVMPHFDPVKPRLHPDTGEMVYDIHPEQAYVFDTYESVNIPSNMDAIIITRSTLNRVGIRITSGNWDSGFCGTLGGLLTSTSIKAVIAQGARIAQIKFTEANSASLYEGQYQNGNSQTKGN